MLNLSKKFGKFCLENHLVVTTAESCTAGLIAATIAETPGSSAWLESGFVVYTAKAKSQLLNVYPATIEQYNITSMQVAAEMAWGAKEKSSSNLILAVTGVAGPSGGTADIPVGTVCMAWLFDRGDEIITHDETCVFNGSRNEIREQVVEYMLNAAMKYYQDIDTV